MHEIIMEKKKGMKLDEEAQEEFKWGVCGTEWYKFSTQWNSQKLVT